MLCVRPRLRRALAYILLLVLFAQLTGAAVRLSATVDEGFHITSGYEYLRTGRLRLFDEHVPLVKALFAWPLFFVPDLPPPETTAGYEQGDLIRVARETVLAYRPIDRVIVASRIPVVLLAVLLASTVYRWARAWFGPAAGLLALALLSFDPNLIAHSSLATTDLGATAFIFWSVGAFACYLRAPSTRRWWPAAILLGLAQSAKLTALLLLPVLGLLALVDAWNIASEDRLRALVRRALSYAGMVAVAGVVVWAMYGFEVRPLEGVAGGILPLPAASHVERWLRLEDNIAYGREAFLLGQNRMHGWWQYFPVTFLLKTPLPTLLLIVWAIAALLRGRRRSWVQEITLALFPLSYGLLSLTSTLNMGYRHLLPVLPFLFVFAARVAPARRPSSPVARPLLALLVAWLTVTSMLTFPHYVTYFNEVVGGPSEGYRFLADSNTDWGQALRALANYQREHDLGTVQLSAFTFLDPAAYGVDYEPIPPLRGVPPILPRRFNPAPGLYAISATTLDGVPLPLPSTYDWFRHREPRARVGNAIFLYEVREDADGEWIAQCTVPRTPLHPQAIVEGFGIDNLRAIAFDCERSWIFPAGGTSRGWYALATGGTDALRWPQDGERLEWWPAWVDTLPLEEELHLSYVQPVPGDLPAFATWEWRGTAVVPPTPVESVSLDGTVRLLGYHMSGTPTPGASTDLVTYWRVEGPPSYPLSLMLHLRDAGGVPVAVGDGLGVWTDQWQMGDVIAQRHVLTLPAATEPGIYSLVTGAYRLDDLSHLGAEIPLTTLTIR